MMTPHQEKRAEAWMVGWRHGAGEHDSAGYMFIAQFAGAYRVGLNAGRLARARALEFADHYATTTTAHTGNAVRG